MNIDIDSYVTVIPNDDDNYEIHMVLDGETQRRHPDRQYSVLASATGTAQTQANRANLPLVIVIQPRSRPRRPRRRG